MRRHDPENSLSSDHMSYAASYLAYRSGLELWLRAARRDGATGGHEMEIKKAGSQPSAKGPAEWFTGTVRVDPLFQAPDPALVSGASVTFEPGARTAWHTHPLGQTLIVIAGAGWVQSWGGAINDIRPGDVVSISPG